MTIIVGMSDERLLKESDEFANIIANGLEEVMRNTLESIDNIVAAAKEPSPREPNTSKKIITHSTLSYITYHWNKFVLSTVKPWLDSLFSTSATIIAESVMSIWPSFSVKPINATKNVASQRFIKTSLDRLQFLSDELYQHAREQLDIGLSLDESIPQLSARLMDAAQLTRKKAESVARTEAVAANNMASLIQVQDLGGVGNKTWLAKIDERTRETHKHADDQTVRISQQFNVGLSRLAFPGDPSGPPSETFNCRCTLTYDIDYFELENSSLRVKG